MSLIYEALFFKQKEKWSLGMEENKFNTFRIKSSFKNHFLWLNIMISSLSEGFCHEMLLAAALRCCLTVLKWGLLIFLFSRLSFLSLDVLNDDNNHIFFHIERRSMLLMYTISHYYISFQVLTMVGLFSLGNKHIIYFMPSDVVSFQRYCSVWWLQFFLL